MRDRNFSCFMAYSVFYPPFSCFSGCFISIEPRIKIANPINNQAKKNIVGEIRTTKIAEDSFNDKITNVG